MQEQQSMEPKMTLEQKVSALVAVALLVATPIIVLLRRKPGYRFLDPTKLLVIFLLLNAFATFGYASGQTTAATLLQMFTWGTFILGLVKRRLRWRDIKNGVSWHTQSRGISSLSFLPISDCNLKRWVEPLAVIVIGAIVAIPYSFFGEYLAFAGACLFLFESWDYEKSLNIMLDQLDGLVDSEVISSNVEYYSQPGVPQRPLEETAGIPTGIAPDIQHQIQRRRRPNVVVPDDLVITPSA